MRVRKKRPSLTQVDAENCFRPGRPETDWLDLEPIWCVFRWGGQKTDLASVGVGGGGFLDGPPAAKRQKKGPRPKSVFLGRGGRWKRPKLFSGGHAACDGVAVDGEDRQSVDPGFICTGINPGQVSKCAGIKARILGRRSSPPVSAGLLARGDKQRAIDKIVFSKNIKQKTIQKMARVRSRAFRSPEHLKKFPVQSG